MRGKAGQTSPADGCYLGDGARSSLCMHSRQCFSSGFFSPARVLEACRILDRDLSQNSPNYEVPALSRVNVFFFFLFHYII